MHSEHQQPNRQSWLMCCRCVEKEPDSQQLITIKEKNPEMNKQVAEKLRNRYQSQEKANLLSVKEVAHDIVQDKTHLISVNNNQLEPKIKFNYLSLNCKQNRDNNKGLMAPGAGVTTHISDTKVFLKNQQIRDNPQKPTLWLTNDKSYETVKKPQSGRALNQTTFGTTTSKFIVNDSSTTNLHLTSLKQLYQPNSTQARPSSMPKVTFTYETPRKSYVQTHFIIPNNLAPRSIINVLNQQPQMNSNPFSVDPYDYKMSDKLIVSQPNLHQTTPLMSNFKDKFKLQEVVNMDTPSAIQVSSVSQIPKEFSLNSPEDCLSSYKQLASSTVIAQQPA